MKTRRVDRVQDEAKDIQEFNWCRSLRITGTDVWREAVDLGADLLQPRLKAFFFAVDGDPSGFNRWSSNKTRLHSSVPLVAVGRGGECMRIWSGG